VEVWTGRGASALPPRPDRFEHAGRSTNVFVAAEFATLAGPVVPPDSWRCHTLTTLMRLNVVLPRVFCDANGNVQIRWAASGLPIHL
jgi:hypothetical protein